MSCHDCIFSTEDDCNPNNFVCGCIRLDSEDKPNEHYLHVLHANHTCIQSVSKDNCVGLKAEKATGDQTGL